MNIKIICVGKIKEAFFRDAVDEYSKRLSKYHKLQIIELKDEKTPDNASLTEEQQIKEIEGERILDKLKDEYVIALAIDGKQPDSVELSQKLDRLALNGKSSVAFIIGGSLGLSEAVLKRADEHLSFSKMTFPHQLMRVILLEQIYRAARISANEPYHK